MNGSNFVRIVVAAGMFVTTFFGLPVRAAEVAFRDDFESPDLSAGWTIVRENPERYSLTDRPGFFGIQTERGALGGEPGVSNLLLRDLEGDFILETRLVFDPSAAQHFAGLLVYEDDQNLVTFGFAYAAGERGVFRGLVLLGVDGGVEGTEREGARYDDSNAANPNEVYLRLLRAGDQYVAGYSEDGESFTDVGSITVDLTHQVLVGVGATNGDSEGCGIDCDASIPADFDFFQVSTLDGSPGGDQPDVAVLESVTIDGPSDVASGSTADFAATAFFSDGATIDVTDDATWTLAPPELGEIDGGVLTAATMEATQQVTLVVEYTQLTSGGAATTESDTAVVRINPPPSGSGSLCGAGLACLGLSLALPLVERCRRVKRRRLPPDRMGSL